MKLKSTLTLDKEFILYCELNKIKDPNKLATETFNRGFSLLKYGETPNGNITTKEVRVEVPIEVIVEKEVIKEIIKEVPVEKIVEKEVIIEKEIKVPYEVIKEVPVEVIKEVIKEVQVEVIKEVPVEVLKQGKTKTVTKEIIKEVPIEVIKEVIREVPIEKIVEVVNTKKIDELTQENLKLKQELGNLTNALNNLNKGTFMKNSNLGSLYDE